MIVLKWYFERLPRFTYSYYSLLKTNLYSLNTDDTTISTISIGIRTHVHTLKYTLHSELMQASTSVYQSIQSLFWWLLPWYQRPLISYLFWINWPFDVDSKEEFSMADINCLSSKPKLQPMTSLDHRSKRGFGTTLMGFLDAMLWICDCWAGEMMQIFLGAKGFSQYECGICVSPWCRTMVTMCIVGC